MTTASDKGLDRIPVGPEGSPTYMAKFHGRYGDEEQRFHSYCDEHPDFGFCGAESVAQGLLEGHLRESHKELAPEARPVSAVEGITIPLEDVQRLLPEGTLIVTEQRLAQGLEYRLRTVAALALMRGKHGEKLPEGFIEEQIAIELSSLTAKNRK